MKILILMILFCVGSNAACRGQEPSQSQNVKVYSITGTVVQVDWVASLIVVRNLDTFRNSYDELTISVPQDARIYRGTEAIELSEVEEGDEVKVEYYNSGLSGLKATVIIDTNLSND